MTDRLLIKGGIVLTQDPALGEMAGADVIGAGGRGTNSYPTGRSVA
jgi:hypothetical protein